MRRGVVGVWGIILFVLLAWIISGCSETGIVGDSKENKPPEIWLSSGPVEGDTTGYQVHFYWGGWDPDGEISHFEFVIVDGDPLGFNPEDTTGLDKWRVTASYDSVFRVSADSSPRPVHNNQYTRYDRTHTFFIRAVDLMGKRSKPSYRSFTAWTLAPIMRINRPESSGGVKTLARIITFCWEGTDPIDSPTNTQDPESVRYFWSQVIDTEGIYDPTFDMVQDMNANFWRYEDRFSPWVYWRAPDDSGRCTILGDDEILEINKSHIFAVQGKDEAGAVTAIFTRDVNVRQFIVSQKAGPLLIISEPFLGTYKFLGTILAPERIDLPPGVPLNFTWEADASDYGGEIVCYRYGWDVQDLTNDDDWEVACSPFYRAAPERTWYSGTHIFYLEVYDNTGTVTRGQIMIEVIPFSMERNLLWVDDYYALDPQSPLYETPGESNHDEFWLNICSRVDGFLPDRDVYDCTENNFKAPEIRDVGKYKNIIWIYSSNYDVWSDLVLYTPPDRVGQSGQITINYLVLFLARGGHLWTGGRSDRSGGLASMFADPPLFPASLKFEITRTATDTSGVNSMGYRDYCVTMVDKLMTPWKSTPEMPYRNMDIDGLRYIYLDPDEPLNASHPGLPTRINLWERVVRPGMFFDPQFRGFLYVEVYDPQYWLDVNFVESQRCFTPMYRMRARSTLSVVDMETVAIWVNKYSHIVPDVTGGVAVAAPSVHLGFPLWFFDHDSADSLATVIFNEWQILAEE
jgi:hypothetical protein